MRELRLRWSPTDDFYVSPGDTIGGATGFFIKGGKLINPELFRQTSIEYDWPDLPLEQWRKRIILAICECDFQDGMLTQEQRIEARLAVNNLLDARITLEECLDRLDRLAA